MNGAKMVQVWNANVYHFTCTSSRGPEWWTSKGTERANLQQIADCVEVDRFRQKWGQFKHTTTFDATSEYKYNVGVNFKNTTPHVADTIFQNYYKFNRIYIDDASLRNDLRIKYNSLHGPANALLNFSSEHWHRYKKYYRVVEFDDIFVSTPVAGDDVILELDPTTMDVFADPIILQINDVIHHAEPGVYECGTGILNINRVVNRIQENRIVKNPPLVGINFRYL
jgi:hypothetical protein